MLILEISKLFKTNWKLEIEILILNPLDQIFNLKKIAQNGALAVPGCSLTSVALRRPLQKALMFGMIAAKRLVLGAISSIV